MQSPPRFGIVISTYNRPDALRLALSSVIAQTETDWRAWVVGDCCDKRTAEVVESFADPRILYVNLPERCGEQSGPNSVGLRLAEAKYIAFLNHDDIWTSDHLREAGAALDGANGAAIYIARAAFCSVKPANDQRLVFTEVSPERRSFSEAFSRPFYYIEPASSWVLTAALVDRLGDWKSAAELYRTPIEDYFLRSWRCGGQLINGPRATVIKSRFATRIPDGQTEYQQSILGGDTLLGLATTAPDSLRQLIGDDVRMSRELRYARNFLRPEAFGDGLEAALYKWLNARSAWLFKLTGFDVFGWLTRKFNVERGGILREAAFRRTGEVLPERPDINRLADVARARLEEAESDG